MVGKGKHERIERGGWGRTHSLTATECHCFLREETAGSGSLQGFSGLWRWEELHFGILLRIECCFTCLAYKSFQTENLTM